MSYISDLHVHLGLKKANNETIDSLWKYYDNPPPKRFFFFFNLFRTLGLNKAYKNYATFTQCNLENCIDGNLRLVVCALYPIERPYVKRRNFMTSVWSALNFFKPKFPFIQPFNKKKNFLTALVRTLVGMSQNKANTIWNQQKNKEDYIDYFEEYKIEYNQLFEAQSSVSADPKYQGKSFKLVRDYEELQQHINNPNVICAILSLEGLHGLAKYRVDHIFSDKNIDTISSAERQKLLKSLSDNINFVKRDPNMAPFYITLSHHFNNLVSGQCISFTGAMTMFFKQKGGLNGPLTNYGRQIINRLLSRANGMQRILIDIKHMSIETRRAYYQIVDVMDNAGDQVPIIASHAAINGVETLDKAKEVKCTKKVNKKSYVSRCDVNLTNEDIIEIYKSNGLIGILMHDGRMPGDIYKKTFKKTEDQQEKKWLQQQLFLTNVYHIIQVLHKDREEFAWDIITLGSDMDGLIDPFDNYSKAGNLTAFRNHIFTYLDTYNTIPDTFKIRDIYANHNGSVFITNDQLKLLNANLSTKDIVDKIFYKNLETFLSNYFTKKYLFNIVSP